MTSSDPLTAALAAPIEADAVADAVRRATERAHAEGAVDVTYAEVDSPLGPLLAARTQTGLVRLAYRDFNGGTDAVLDHLSIRVSPRIVEAPRDLDDVRRQLDEYFNGDRRAFDLPVDLSLAAGFTQRILQAIAAIPFGATASYRDVAAKAGNEKAVRAAGNACSANPVPIVVPCHRVLRTGGGLGGYTGGVEKKERLLRLEGHPLG
ncbi:MAG TPA: methylated-DNA--[protein]-cysteine S-methyltransferase [Solirubrobacteraceae bacterium]|nr:methylated-DNA--[protein]-cysteine S-methyltransferase [Solirubrobacteraceae bacterium]